MGVSIMELGGPEDSPDTTSFEISAKEARKFRIGDKVEMYISGVVGMLEVPPDDLGDKSDRTDSTLGIRVLEKRLTNVGKVSEQELGIKELDGVESDDA